VKLDVLNKKRQNFVLFHAYAYRKKCISIATILTKNASNALKLAWMEFDTVDWRNVICTLKCNDQTDVALHLLLSIPTSRTYYFECRRELVNHFGCGAGPIKTRMYL